MGGRSLDTYRRAALLSLQHDLMRGIVATALFILLLGLGSSAIVALVGATLTYLGLRLAASSLDPTIERQTTIRPVPRNGYEALTMCWDLRSKLGMLCHTIDNALDSPQFDHLVPRVDQLLVAIGEDERYDLSPTMLNLMETMLDLLTQFAKVVSRGATSAAMFDAVERDLATLQSAFDSLWRKLNRDAIASLTAISEMIEFDHSRVAETHQNGGAR